MSCSVRYLNKSKSISIHRLVALHFIDNPLNKPQVNHKDANKENNHVDNLEWCTAKENMTHVSKNGLNPLSRKCCEVDDDNNIINIYPSQTFIGSILKVHICYIRDCCAGKTDKIKNIKIRYYDEGSNNYIKTRYDRDEVKLKGKYRRQIYCSNNNKIYNSQMNCANDLGISQKQVSEKLRLNKDCGFELKYLI